MSELRGLEQQLVNLKDQCWNLEQKISYLCECLGGVQTALERGETKPQQEPPKYKGATCRGSYVLGTACGLCERCEDEKRRMVVASKPAPATVEKYRTVRYFFVEAHGYVQRDTGEVVANRYLDGDLWYVQLDNKKDAVVMADDTYRALVDMMLDNKYWERTNE